MLEEDLMVIDEGEASSNILGKKMNFPKKECYNSLTSVFH
jgi:hypothetical protein